MLDLDILLIWRLVLTLFDILHGIGNRTYLVTEERFNQGRDKLNNEIKALILKLKVF